MIKRIPTAQRASLLLLSLCLLGPARMSAATPSPTTTVLTISPASSVAVGTTVTLTASVSSGGKPVSPGLVLFCNAAAAHCEDVNILGQAQLTSAGAATTKLRLAVGSHSVKAEFQGTHLYARSASSAQDLMVTGKFTTSTGIVASGLNFIGTVTSNGIAAAGTVSFLDSTDSGSLLASVPLNVVSRATVLTEVPPLQSYFPSGIAVGDFNGDGIPDLAMVNPVCCGGLATTVSILLGNGDGTFTTKSTLGVGLGASGIAAADFNGDGVPDLAVTNTSDGTVSILLGNGDGIFTVTTSPHFLYGISSLMVADFNGDGIEDLVATSSLEENLAILLGNGDGTFTRKSTPSVGYFGNPQSAAVGDFNGDGIPDLAVVNYTNGYPESTFIILLGNGDGTFTTKLTPDVGNGPPRGGGGGLQPRWDTGSGGDELHRRHGEHSVGQWGWNLYHQIDASRWQRWGGDGGGRLQRRRDSGSGGVELRLWHGEHSAREWGRNVCH